MLHLQVRECASGYFNKPGQSRQAPHQGSHRMLLQSLNHCCSPSTTPACQSGRCKWDLGGDEPHERKPGWRSSVALEHAPHCLHSFKQGCIQPCVLPCLQHSGHHPRPCSPAVALGAAPDTQPRSGHCTGDTRSISAVSAGALQAAMSALEGQAAAERVQRDAAVASAGKAAEAVAAAEGEATRLLRELATAKANLKEAQGTIHSLRCALRRGSIQGPARRLGALRVR